jgi:exosome complex exonuclease RRP6
VVNLFDTFHATKVLEIRPHSLANLLALYCGYRADKKYQMADWRIRPLTKEMKLYAQADTHFILSIYDNLRNALLEKSRAPSPDPEHAGSPAPSAATNPQRAMREVLRLSGETALRMWSPEPYTENGSGSSGWKTGITKSFLGKVAADSEVGIMYKRIHMWRDRVAREEDESVS